MRNPLTLIALLAMAGCTENSISQLNDAYYGEGYVLQGRVCDPDRNTWLEEALIYTHLYGADEHVFDTREATSDASGAWTLEDMPGGRVYTIYVQYGSELLDMFNVDMPEGDKLLDDPDCGGGDATVAVIDGDYDAMDEVITELGYGSYDLVDGEDPAALQSFLLSTAAMSEYDILFFNGGHAEEDIFYDTDGSDTGGLVPQVITSLQDYVAQGGIIWATDWSYNVVEEAWPDAVDFVGEDSVPDAAQVGEPGTTTASVSNPDLAAAINADEFNIVFDMIVWPPIQAAGPDTTVHLRGDVEFRDGFDIYTLGDAPLLVSFPYGDGLVVFSSYRQTANASGKSMQAAKYMVDNL